MTIKTRFAPSPTGYMHIGGLRTALYCYLWAKKNNGIFVLRVEDTDQTRLVEGATENLLFMLDKFGISPDEGPHKDLGNGPYYQSQRLPIYQKYLHGMVESGHAYYCFCTSERLEKLHEEQTALKLPTKYDGHCRNLPLEETKVRVANGEPYTIRLKVPKGEKIVFNDLIRGKMEWNSSDVDDQVLLKSDGFPTYHGAIVIDDHLMGITHAFRGEEWISSIPKQVLTARALNMPLPQFAHMANIMGSDGKKLSKRTGDTAVETYIEKGYLTEALLNFIAFLGWNPKTTQEIFTLEELVAAFDVKDMNKAGALLDMEKLNWMNSKYIQAMDDEDLYTRLESYLKEYKKDFYETYFSKKSKEYNGKILKELKTRLRTFAEFPDLTVFFYNEPKDRSDLLVNPKMKIESLDIAKKWLELALEILSANIDFNSPESIKNTCIEKIALAEMKNGQVLWPVRVALSGEEFSPGALELIYILWKDLSIQRIKKILEKIG